MLQKILMRRWSLCRIAHIIGATVQIVKKHGYVYNRTGEVLDESERGNAMEEIRGQLAALADQIDAMRRRL